MAVTIEQFNAQVKQLLSKAQTEFPAINARLALSALSMVRNRIINRGVDHNGKAFGKYSTNKLPYFYFQNKGMSKGADKKFEKAQDKDPKGISYETWRSMNGLQTNYVDMKFTGETLRDFAVLETKTEGGVIVTIVASKNSITKKNGKTTVTTGEVAGYLQEQYGDFMQVSAEETKILEETLDDEVQKLLDETFI